MKRSTFFYVATAMLASLVLICGVTWAQSIKIPITGVDELALSDPGIEWTDEEGITHYRGVVYAGVGAGQDIDGVPINGTCVYVYNVNIDMVTGDGDINGTSFVEETYGDLTGTWEGRFAGTIEGFVITCNFNYPHGSGDFAGWHARGVVTAIFGGSSDQWEGIIHIPGGGGGDKAATAESQTWSSVKTLYR